jgi:ATP adenylyltransferase
MEKLWSPWRSKYIDSINQKDKPAGCVFCKSKDLNPNDSDNLLVDKAKFTYTMLNLYPYNNGHLMIIPFRHLDDLTLLNEKENLEMMQKLQDALKILKDVLKPDGFNIGLNLGRVSGAGIADHIHFHIVPRWNGDTNFMPVLGEVKVISQDLLITKQKLLEAYSRLS